MEKCKLSQLLFVNLSRCGTELDVYGTEMYLNGKFVPVKSLKSEKMENQNFILYSLKELFEKYPSTIKRGWTEDDVITWLNQDIIMGVLSEDKNEIKIEKQSFEDFIEYHNSFLKKRIEVMNEGFKKLKKV